MAVNRCREFVHVFQRRSLFTSNGVKCLLVGYFPRAPISTSKYSTVNTTETSSLVSNIGKSEQSSGSDSSSHKEEEEHKKYEENIKVKILHASLPFVHNYGWSKDAITAGAESLGYPGIVHGMFPRGAAELIQHFYAHCNSELVEKLKKEVEYEQTTDNTLNAEGQSHSETAASTKQPKDPKVVIAFAVKTRLRMIEPYLSHWPQALAIMTLPPNVPTSLANLLTLVDDIWYYAGDRSVDFNWYTRRVALAGIYKVTELYMIQDGSPDHSETWTFLNRRLDEATQLHSLFVQSESAAQFAKDIASSTFITARNMLGLNWNR